jgi:tetratricopeptide (TPR) repeat protein
MSKGGTPARPVHPPDDLTERYGDQINLMLTMIRLSRLGGIATVECDDIGLRKRLFRHFRQKLREANIYLYPVEITERDCNLVRLLRDLTERSGFKDLELIGRYENIALFAYGLEKFDDERQEAFLNSLNLFRDATTIIRQPIILWATHEFVSRMAREAPDFWSWKGMLFKFSGNGHEAPLESRLPPIQRYLHDLLNDPDFAIWRDLYVPVRGLPLRTPPAWSSTTRPPVQEPSHNALPRRRATKSTSAKRVVNAAGNLLTLLAHHDSVVVLGAPGAGKTSLLRYLTQAQARRAWKSLRGGQQPEAVPVFVRLNLMRTGRSLEQLVLDALHQFHFTSIEDLDQLRRILDGGPATEQAGLLPDHRFLFLLDGMGEAPPERRAEIQSFVQRHLPRHRVITSCRTENYVPLNGLRALLIEPLSDMDIERYTVRYLGETRGQQLAREILDDPSLTDLARSPLALYMLTRIADDSARDETLPKNRGVLFQRFTDNLLRRTKTEWWRVFRRTRSDVALEISRHALARLAYEMQQGRVTDISAEQAHWFIREAAYLTPSPAPAREVFDGLLHSGLIRLSGDRAHVEFMHQAVREYFAALYLQEAGESIATLLAEEQGRQTWGGTITLLFGIADDHLSLYQDIVGDGTDYQRLWLAARCLATLPQESSSLVKIGEAVAKDPHQAAIFDLCRGLAHEGQGEFREAIALFRRALTLAPDLAFGYYDLGCVLRQVGRPDFAVAALKEAIRHRPDFVDAYNHLGITFFEQRDYRRALQVFAAAVELEPDNAYHYFNVGLALQVLQRYEKAAEAFAHALRLEADYEEAARQLKWLRKAKETPTLPLLDHVDLFRDLPLEQRLALAQRLEVEQFPAGTPIIEEGVAADRMFVIARGEVEVQASSAKGATQGTSRLHIGDHFGEAVLIGGGRQTVAATAVTDVELLTLSKRQFDDVKSRFPRLAERLVQTRRERMSQTARGGRRTSAQPVERRTNGGDRWA